jgi:multidrug efflux system membrane fusion protein
MSSFFNLRPGQSTRWIRSSLLLALITLSGCTDKSQPAGRGGGGAAAPVLAGKVQRKTVPLVLDAIGAVEPIRTAGVRSQVTGVLLRIAFKEGEDVKQGDLLFEIDPRPFQLALRSAEADLQKARVQLETAESEVVRYKGLNDQGLVSKEQFQTIQDNARTLRAALASSDAAAENDRLQLEFCSITAPITGRTGSLGAHEGDLVRASDANIALVVVNQLSPIYVTFSVPQQYLAALNRYRAAGSLSVTAAPTSDAAAPERGDLTFIDNAIDPTTGTLKLKAVFPNEGHVLWPGQFADVHVTLASPEVLVVPSSAVQSDQAGQHVFVIKDDHTAELRTVTVERSTEIEAVISKGLAEGETIVTDGQVRVLPGKPVEIKSSGAASSEAGARTKANPKGP